MAPVLLPVLLLVAAMVVVIIVAGPPYSLRALLNDVPGPAGDMGWGMLATAILWSQLLLWLKIVITVVVVGAVAVVLEVVSERVAGGWFRYLRNAFFSSADRCPFWWREYISRC